MLLLVIWVLLLELEFFDAWPYLTDERTFKGFFMAEVIVYTGLACGYCQRAKALLSQKGVDFEEILVSLDPALRDEMIARANGARTVPQIFIDDIHVGGCDELYTLERAGKLDTMIGTSVREDTA